MPETKRIVVYFEGDDDKAFLEQLLEAKALPADCQLAVRDKKHHPGKDGLIAQLLPQVSPANGLGGQAIVLLDLDEFDPAGRAEWFQAELRKALAANPSYAGVTVAAHAVQGRIHLLHLVAGERQGRIAFVPVGAWGDADWSKPRGIDRFALDDWTLKLAECPAAYRAVSDFKSVTYDIAMRKFKEVADLFRANGLEFRKAKNYLMVLRTLAAIGPTSATITGRMVKNSFAALKEQGVRKIIGPFLDDLAAAAALLRGPET